MSGEKNVQGQSKVRSFPKKSQEKLKLFNVTDPFEGWLVETFGVIFS